MKKIMAVTVRRNWDSNNNNQIDSDSIESNAKTIITEDEGSQIDAAATTLNFIGAGVTASDAGSNVTSITVPGGGAGIETQDEGSQIDAAATTLNFIGAGVTASDAGSNVTNVTIPGGGGGGGGAAYSQDFGDAAATNFVITHNLGTKDLVVECYDNTTPFDQVYPTISHTSLNTITIDTGLTIPTLNQYRVVISAGGGGIATQDEGVSIDAAATTLNFIGAGVTASDAGSNVTNVTIPGGGTGSIETQDEGSQIDAAATTLNFIGAGVTASDAGSNVTNVTIPGGGTITVSESTLTGDLQLLESSETFQVLNPNAASRQVVVPSAPTGNPYFVIINDSDGLSANGNTLLLKESLGGATILTLDDTTGLKNIRVLYTGTKYIWF